MSIESRLSQALSGTNSCTVAVSGGVDSVTLAVFAHRLRPLQTEVAHAISPAVPKQATARVEAIARAEGWRLRIVQPSEFEDANYVNNPPNRCYFCKTHLYETLHSVIGGTILSGANRDDLSDYRPGLIAAGEQGVRHPFVEAAMNKSDVRGLARNLGLGEIAELPASPCLSSRVESGIPISAEDLLAIDAVETALKQYFRGDLRCRVRGPGIVVEINANCFAALTDADREVINQTVCNVFEGRKGRTFLGVESYRMGSAFLRKGQS